MALTVPLVWSPRSDSAVPLMIEPTISCYQGGPVLSTEWIPPQGRELKFLIRDDAAFSDTAQSLRMLRPGGELQNSILLNSSHVMTSPEKHLGLNVPWGSLYLRQTPSSFIGLLDIFWQMSKFQKLLCLQKSQVLGNFLTLEKLSL